ASSTSLVAWVSGGRRTRNQTRSTAATAAHAIAAAISGLAMIQDTIDMLAGSSGDDEVAECIDGAGMAGRTRGERHVRRVARARGRNPVTAPAADLSGLGPPRPPGAVARRGRAGLARAIPAQARADLGGPARVDVAGRVDG